LERQQSRALLLGRFSPAVRNCCALDQQQISSNHSTLRGLGRNWDGNRQQSSHPKERNFPHSSYAQPAQSSRIDPLPKGEGARRPACELFECVRCAEGLPGILPLPLGEGRGEGNLSGDNLGHCCWDVFRQQYGIATFRISNKSLVTTAFCLPGTEFGTEIASTVPPGKRKFSHSSYPAIHPPPPLT
jgi:hypothetical protein